MHIVVDHVKFSFLDKNNCTNIHDNTLATQYAATLALNQNEIGKNQQEYQKLNLLWVNIIRKTSSFHQENMTGRHLEKNNLKILLMEIFCIDIVIYPPYFSKRNS